ncbi:hypothetical protein C7E17_22125 [Stenotrophomonas maltophilia]|nr:hypothetical protein C7E17_22125 [Stenotrophomonas maltophilia]
MFITPGYRIRSVDAMVTNFHLPESTLLMLLPFAGETQIFITPGYRIRSVDAMVTNFHLPESTLLMMISAFAGKERVFEAYQHAIEQRYRFFSYGDAMLLFPQAG